MPLSRSGWFRLAIILLGLYVFGQATPVLLPLILATVFAFILYPLVRFFAQLRWSSQKTIPKELAILISFAIAAIVISVVISYIFMPFVGEFNQFIANLPSLAERAKQITLSLGMQAQSVDLPDNVRVLFDNSLSNAASYSIGVARRLINAILGLAGQIIELIVVPVLAFYFLRDWRLLRDNFVNAFPIPARAKTRQIVDEMGIVVSAYIRGQVLVSVVMGIVVFIGMMFLGVSYPLVLGLVAALTEAIPVVGPIIGAVPALLLAFLESPALAVKVLVFYVIIHQLENNVIVPSIMKATLELHPVSVIISLLIGAHVAGVLGMLVAVPVTAMLKVLYKHLWHYQES